MTSEWTLATALTAAETVARAHGLDARAFFVSGPGLGSLRVEVLGELAQGESGSQPHHDHLIAQTMPIDLDTRAVMCWTEIPCAALDVADSEPGGASALVERAVSEVIRMQHGKGAAA